MEPTPEARNGMYSTTGVELIHLLRMVHGGFHHVRARVHHTVEGLFG